MATSAEPRGYGGLLAGVLLLAVVSALIVLPRSASAYTVRGPIHIVTDADFTAAQGVTGGTGTPADPYVIQGWEIRAPSTFYGIDIEFTTARFVIRDVFVHAPNDTAYDGIYLRGTSFARIENATVSGASSGIHLDGVYNVTISGSTLQVNQVYGIEIEFADIVNLTGNRFESNAWEGVHIWSSQGVSMSGNVLSSDGVLIYDRCGADLTACVDDFNSHTITPDNLVNGAPLRFYKNCNDVTIDGLVTGQLIVANCTRFSAKNLQLTDADVGAEFAYVDWATLSSSNVSRNRMEGVFVYASTNLTLVGNDLTDSSYYDVYVDRVSGLNISGNRISASLSGVRLWNSAGGAIVDNNITGNQVGVILDNATGFRVFHNRFEWNARQAMGRVNATTWDNGYPSGGNFWSDYYGTDCCSGPLQEVRGAPDGIGDTPYVIDTNVTDRYPLDPDPRPNIPPLARFHTSAASVKAGERVLADASDSTDYDGSPLELEVRWDWEGDGTWDTNWSTQKVASHVYAEGGTYEIRVQVRDRCLAMTDAVREITVSPPPPPIPSFVHPAFVVLAASCVAGAAAVLLLRRSGRVHRERPPTRN